MSIKKTLSTWPSLAASRPYMVLHDRDSLRLKLALSRELKVTSQPPPDLTLPRSRAHRWGYPFIGQSAWNLFKNLAWQTHRLKRIQDQWTESPERLTEHTTLLQHPPPTRDWHGGPFPPHGKLAQGLSLTMRPTKTASPLWKFSPQWPETWRCANILSLFGHVFKNSAILYNRNKCALIFNLSLIRWLCHWWITTKGPFLKEP